ncbi:hypothetical protein M8J77_010931 [Diaphorina citri]|nr:hypothetical protein M8J77_010931 [Diaphorina citri]
MVSGKYAAPQQSLQCLTPITTSNHQRTKSEEAMQKNHPSGTRHEISFRYSFSRHTAERHPKHQHPLANQEVAKHLHQWKTDICI